MTSWQDTPLIVGEHVTSYGNMREAALAALKETDPSPIPPHTYKGMAVSILALLEVLESQDTA